MNRQELNQTTMAVMLLGEVSVISVRRPGRGLDGLPVLRFRCGRCGVREVRRAA
jgi:hypothetical protein